MVGADRAPLGQPGGAAESRRRAASTRAPAEPEPPREPRFWERDVSFSDLVGPKAFAIAGGIVTLLGVVFFFVLAANRGWIGPELRVLLGAAASAAVFAGGFWLRRREPDSYSSLAAVGAGLAGGYVTLAAATVLYGLVPAALALPIAAGLAAVGVAVALAWSSELVAVFGLLGAIAAPALLALDEGITAAGSAFVAIVFAASAVVALRERWPDLFAVAALASIAQAVWLVLASDTSDWGTVTVSAAFASILVATGVASEISRRFSFSASLVLAGAAFAAFAARMLFDGDDLGVALAVVGAAFAVLAAALFARGRLTDLSSLAGAVALSFGAVAAAELLSGQSLAIAFAAQAALLAWLARAIDEPRYQLGALAYSGLALGHVLLVDAPVTDLFTPELHPAAGTPSVVALAAACAVAAWFAIWEGSRGPRRLAELDRAVRDAQPTVRPVAGVIALVLAVYAGALGILGLAQLTAGDQAAEIDAAFEWGHVAVTTTAALAALAAFLIAGRVGGAVVRAAVSVALGVLLVKVALFDLIVLEPELAGWSALALGAVLFLVSVLSHRLRPVVEELDVVSVAWAVFAAGLGAVAVVRLLEGAWGSVDLEGLGMVGLALPFALVGALELRRFRDYASLQFGLAVIALGAGTILLLEGNWLVFAWAALAVALSGVTVLSGESRFLIAAHAYAGLAVVYTLGVAAPPADLFVAASDPGSGVAAVVLAAAAALVAALLARREERSGASGERPLPVAVRSALPALAEAGLWIAGALGVYALSLSLLQLAAWLSPASVDTDFERGHVAVSASWAIVGLALLSIGLRYRVTRLRVAGLALFAVSIAKLFLYDLTFLTSVTRAFSFLAVGTLLLLAGFFYQRQVKSGGSAPA